MKECDKRNSHISSELHIIYISSNNVRHPVIRPSLHFTYFTQKHLTPLNIIMLYILGHEIKLRLTFERTDFF
jgi:hypothetical protein